MILTTVVCIAVIVNHNQKLQNKVVELNIDKKQLVNTNNELVKVAKVQENVGINNAKAVSQLSKKVIKNQKVATTRIKDMEQEVNAVISSDLDEVKKAYETSSLVFKHIQRTPLSQSENA